MTDQYMGNFTISKKKKYLKNQSGPIWKVNNERSKHDHNRGPILSKLQIKRLDSPLTSIQPSQILPLGTKFSLLLLKKSSELTNRRKKQGLYSEMAMAGHIRSNINLSNRLLRAGSLSPHSHRSTLNQTLLCPEVTLIASQIFLFLIYFF